MDLELKANDSPKLPALANAKKRKKGGCIGRLLLCGVFFVAVTAGGLYFSRDLLRDKANMMLKEELALAGIHVEYESVDYRALRGLIVKNVVFFKSRERAEPVMKISDAACVFSPIDLLLGKSFSGKITIDDGKIALVSGERETIYREIEADIFWLGDTIDIQQMNTSAAGMKIDVKGILVLKEDGSESKGPIFPDFTPVIDAMEGMKVKAKGAPPNLSVNLHTIEGSPHFPLNIEASLIGEDFSWEQATFENLDVSLTFNAAEEGAIFPAKISVEGKGEGLAWGDLSIGSLEIIDAVVTPEMVGAVFPVRISVKGEGKDVAWRELSISSLENIDAVASPAKEGTVFPVSISVKGEGKGVAWGELSFRSLALIDAVATPAEEGAVFPAKISVEGKGEGVAWRDLSIGSLEIIDAVVTPEMEGAVFPVRIASNIQGEKVAWDDFNSGKTRAQVSVEPSPGKAEPFSIHLESKNSEFGWDKAKFEQVDLNLRYLDEDHLAIDRLMAKGYGGVIEAVGLVSPLSNRMSLEKMDSTADLITIAGELDPGVGKMLSGLRFTRNPTVSASNSLLKFDDVAGSQFHVRCVESGDVAIDIGDREIELKEVLFTASLASGTLRVPDLEFQIMGGTGKVVMTVPLRSDPLEYELTAAVDGVQIEQLARLTGASSVEHLKGDLQGNFLGKGGAVIEDFEGAGMIEMTHAKLYEARVVGPLWGFVRRHDERLRGDQEQEMVANYKLKDGVLTTKNFVLATSLAKLMVDGSFDLVQYTVNLNARVNLKGAIGLATAVASRVLEVHGEGPVDNVEFSLKNQVIGGVVKGGAGVVKTGVGAVRDGAGVLRDGAGGVLEGAGEKMRDAANSLRPRNFLRRDKGKEEVE